MKTSSKKMRKKNEGNLYKKKSKMKTTSKKMKKMKTTSKKMEKNEDDLKKKKMAVT